MTVSDIPHRNIALVLALLLVLCTGIARAEVNPPVPKVPEGIDIAWRCDGMIIAIVEKQLEGVSRGGTYIQDDVETTIWIYNPLRLPLPTTFIFKQYQTAHPYSTWGAELVGGQCQEVFFGTALEDRLPEKMRNLAKIVRLEKSSEFKRCIKENPDEHQMCRDAADGAEMPKELWGYWCHKDKGWVRCKEETWDGLCCRIDRKEMASEHTRCKTLSVRKVKDHTWVIKQRCAYGSVEDKKDPAGEGSATTTTQFERRGVHLYAKEIK